MSFMRRISNLAKGMWIAKTRPAASVDALDAELRERPPSRKAESRPAPQAEEQAATWKPQGPERDAEGKIKKTL